MAIIRHNLHFWSQKYEEFTQLIVSFIALLTVLFSQNSLKAVDLIFFPLGTNDIITAAVLVPNVRAIVSSKQVFTNGITGLTGTAVDLYNNFYKADN